MPPCVFCIDARIELVIFNNNVNSSKEALVCLRIGGLHPCRGEAIASDAREDVHDLDAHVAELAADLLLFLCLRVDGYRAVDHSPKALCYALHVPHPVHGNTSGVLCGLATHG